MFFSVTSGCIIFLFLALLEVVLITYMKKYERPDAGLIKTGTNDRKEWNIGTIFELFKAALPLLFLIFNLVYFIYFV